MTDHDNPANELKGLNVKYEKLIGEKDEIIRDLKDRITALEISSSKKSVKDSIGENFLREATNGNADEWLGYYKGFRGGGVGVCQELGFEGGDRGDCVNLSSIIGSPEEGGDLMESAFKKKDWDVRKEDKCLQADDDYQELVVQNARIVKE